MNTVIVVATEASRKRAANGIHLVQVSTTTIGKSMVPDSRILSANGKDVCADGDYVLYWMIAFRRTRWNFALDRAIDWASSLRKPLLIFEPLRVGYSWASDRLHRYVIDGMANNAARVASAGACGVEYYPYVESKNGAGKGLLAALARRACVVVTDDYPSFFLPRMVTAAAAALNVRLESVDSNGLLPMRAVNRAFTTAFSFRGALQRELLRHLQQAPEAEPLESLRLPSFATLPDDITRRWPRAGDRLLAGGARELAALPIDHSVEIVEERGGSAAAQQRLQRFLDQQLRNYAEYAKHPDADAVSCLSAYLHFGQISTHEIFQELARCEDWSVEKLAHRTGGKREGWWNMSPSAEAWLDQLVTWRELGYNMATHAEYFDSYESLPEWSRMTLEKHARDKREFLYSLDEFAAAKTHDEVWNAAQRQLLREGRIHNYLRMLWGKKILEWSASPREALAVMVELNNRYALDGRDPNSYSGIFWCLGRYDRPWGPERPVFGTVRFMSSENTRRKLRMREYLKRYGLPSERG